MNDLFTTLQARGYVAGFSEPLNEVRALLDGQTTIYQGFDPTAASLHVGHLQSLMIFHRMQQAGHRLIFLIGGATALVGDPSGRDASRPLLSAETVAANAHAIRTQVERMGLIRFTDAPGMGPAALLLNNADWLDMGLLGYLRDVAVHFSVNALIKQETFARRLAEQRNLSLLELLYPSLQAYDFLHLCDSFDCRLQMGGSDQWGNIVDGIDLVRRVRGVTVHGLVFPLLLDRQTGQKMGKTSAGQTVWLDPERTPPFAFYQSWLACPDVDLARNLALFTFLPAAEITAIAAGSPRDAQHRLAYEVTAIVHGPAAAAQAQTDARAAFGVNAGLPQDVPALVVTEAELSAGLSVPVALVRAKMLPSLGAARRLIQQGGVRLNGARLTDLNQPLALDAFDTRQDEQAALVQFGRGKLLKVRLVG
jgi:tyrosyl-tRNA synthetase